MENIMSIQLKPNVIGVLILVLAVGCSKEENIAQLSKQPIVVEISTATLTRKTPIPPTEMPTVTASKTPTSSPNEPTTATPTKTPKPSRTLIPTPDLTILGKIGGGMIAYVSNRDGDNEIYLLIFPKEDSDPMNEIQLTHNEDDDVLSDWSPDGSKIAFSSDRDGNLEIYVMDVDAALQNEGYGSVQRLTNHEGEDMLPAWSPDGNKIAFSSDRDGDWEIYIMQADGTDIRQLTDNTIIDSKPSWSPDGTKIVFDSGEGYNRNIYIMESNGANQELIIQAEGGWPDWSPDGTQIVFFGRLTGNPEIYIVNVDGTNLTRMTFNNIDDWEPSWSPDGEWLLYNAGQRNNIFVMRVDRSETYQLTDSSSLDWLPIWRP